MSNDFDFADFSDYFQDHPEEFEFELTQSPILIKKKTATVKIIINVPLHHKTKVRKILKDKPDYFINNVVELIENY